SLRRGLPHARCKPVPPAPAASSCASEDATMTALVETARHRVAGTREPLAAVQVLAFALQGETFAMPIAQIKEIIGYDEVTPVPMMPDFICGVINLRGAVVPVIDLGCRLHGTRREIGKRSCIVILELRMDNDWQVVG